jgi:hypothetical protein
MDQSSSPLTIQIMETQEPSTLVCTHMSCYYCGFIGNIDFQYINYYFGIKRCSNQSCQDKAKRDCATYMRKNNMLLMERELIAKFGLVDTKFSVTRSNGDIEYGWRISFSQILNYAEFMKWNDQWHIKVIKYDDSKIDSAIEKMVPVSSIHFSDELVQKLIDYEDYPDNNYIIVDNSEVKSTNVVYR